MRIRLAKKILRGLYREHIPYTEDQIDSAYRRIGRVYGPWDRDFCYTTDPKGYTPRLHSPIQERILEHLFEKGGGWGYDKENIIMIIDDPLVDKDGVYAEPDLEHYRLWLKSIVPVPTQPDHKELPDAIQ